MTERPKFTTRSFRLVGVDQLGTLMALLPNLPLDAERPLEVVIREEPKARKPDQNSAMWVGPLADIAGQAWVEGKQYTADVWHEEFKERYLPEEYDPELTKEGYRKWDYTPSGKRVLVGSTTQLLVHGFALYLQQVEAFGASLGVTYSANPRESR